MNAPAAWVGMDREKLTAVLTHLVRNSQDATARDGRIKIGVATEADGLIITVADTGTGMSQDILSKAFDPFFTTKPIGSGTGLGLSMIYGFAKQSGGHVRIDSQPGKGTTITLFLPRHRPTPSS